MKNISIEIEGICPILFNRFFDPKSLESPGGRKPTQKLIDEVKFKVYRKGNGKSDIGMPAENIKKSLLLGCSSAGIKVGRRGAMPYMRATVFVDPEFVSFGVKKPDGIHECTGRNPNTRGMVIIRRPYLDTGWKLKYNLCLFDERINPGSVKIALEESASIVALCDHRPEYGRFKINKFETTENK